MTRANRKHVVIYGKTNVGKSALFNAMLGQNRAIVSDKPGTTTDPVEKSMELLPFGPIVLIDTAGLMDNTSLASEREAATKRMLDATDLAIYVCGQDEAPSLDMLDTFSKRKIPYIIVRSKADLGASTDMLSVSVYDEKSIVALKTTVAKMLIEKTDDDPSLIAGLLPEHSQILLVVPIDSAAPKGRLILPQVQLIRACLDSNIRCVVCNENTVPKDMLGIDLVVTDSQVFDMVGKLVPQDIPLTSFSMLMSRQKGDFASLLDSVRAISNLKNGDKVLIAESCTHTTSHEDIGTVKLPKAIEKISGAKLEFDCVCGKDFPDTIDELQEYNLIVHCGGCMITRRMFTSRQKKAVSANTPMTNYGIVLALASGVLDRSLQFEKRH